MRIEIHALAELRPVEPEPRRHRQPQGRRVRRLPPGSHLQPVQKRAVRRYFQDHDLIPGREPRPSVPSGCWNTPANG